MQKASTNKLEEAVDLIANSEVDLSTMFKQDGILRQLTKALVERALQGEISHHLGYERYQHSDSRAYSPKCVNFFIGYNTINFIIERKNEKQQSKK